MISHETRSIIERAKQIYVDQLQAALENGHRDRFVAIEPESGDYFLADTLDGAVRAARPGTRLGCRTLFESVTPPPYTW